MNTHVNKYELYAKRDLYYRVQKDMRDHALVFIYDFLCEHTVNGSSLDLTQLDERVCVAYDGGNHPESASNYASVVEEIFISKEQVYLNTEDTTFYELNMCSTDEILLIAELLADYTEEIDEMTKGSGTKTE